VCHLDQQQIPDVVAERVVDDLETVQIDEEHREQSTLAVGGVQGLRHQDLALIAGQCHPHRLGRSGELNQVGKGCPRHALEWDGVTHGLTLLNGQHGFAAGAESGAVADHRHQGGEVDLERQGTERTLRIEDRCDDEGRHLAPGRRVGLETGHVDVHEDHRLAKARRQFGVAKGAMQEVGAQIGLAAQRKDDIAVRIDQQQVVVIRALAEGRQLRACCRAQRPGRDQCRQGVANQCLARERAGIDQALVSGSSVPAARTAAAHSLTPL